VVERYYIFNVENLKKLTIFSIYNSCPVCAMKKPKRVSEVPQVAIQRIFKKFIKLTKNLTTFLQNIVTFDLFVL
jgi:hypothetical protein